ncbi:MAG: hypothetical protein ABIF19_01000 [Planctomycetota bacterium]
MTAKETIEEKLKELAQVIAPDDELVEHVMSRIDTTSAPTSSALTVQDIWRKIMKSRITKLAAAAVMVIAIVLSIILLDKSATPAYAVTDLPGLFEKAKVIHIQGWQYFAGHRMPDGEEIPPVEIDNWIDLESGRSRFTYTGLSDDRNGIRIMIAESISDAEYKMDLNHSDKSAIFSKISDYQRMLNVYFTSRVVRGQIFGDIEQLQNFEKMGGEQVDEVEYDIWQRDTRHAVVEYAHRLKLWLAPDSGKLGRVQMWSKASDDQWELNYDYLVDYDVVVPDGVFTMESPEGYTLKNTMETAIPLELGSGGGAGYGSFSVNTRIDFLMSDGSVIVAWQSLNNESEIPQDEFFMGLEFGGPLPMLPVEIYGLKPAGASSELTYTGYHLTHIQKAGKFIEWSLYVPDGTPPASVRQLGFDVLYRFNLDPEPKWRIGLTVDCSMLIEGAEDFDKWVLGAMAELSDDGQAPEGITYERVLQLAEKVRESFGK